MQEGGRGESTKQCSMLRENIEKYSVLSLKQRYRTHYISRASHTQSAIAQSNKATNAETRMHTRIQNLLI